MLSPDKRAKKIAEAPPGTWIAFSEDESEVIAQASTYEETVALAESNSKVPYCRSSAYPYKVYPVAGSDPRVPSGTQMASVPLLNVSVIHQHPKSKRLEAYVDSDAPPAFFTALSGEH